MPTPIMNFRLPQAERDALHEMARIYGAKTTSDFLRDMVGAMCSGDAERVKAFNVRLFSKVGEQLGLKFSEPLAAQFPGEPSREVRSSRGKRKPRRKRRERGRTT